MNKYIQDDALFRILALNPQILEVSRIPKRIEVPLDRDRVVGVPFVGKKTRQHRLLGYPPVADHPDMRDRLTR